MLATQNKTAHSFSKNIPFLLGKASVIAGPDLINRVAARNALSDGFMTKLIDLYDFDRYHLDQLLSIA